ncbi:MAG: M23 family metallopeptidase [Spirochaetaceae bacterium]|nr:MAG: M23 family metallopeptidase [Spirochaetaceae bacterium]
MLILPCLLALAAAALILYTHIDPILENARRTEYLQKLDRTFALNPEYLSDGFDYPVGPPDAKGYYCAQEFSVNRHLGEDWNGVRGGNTDINDPVYAAANGVVVFADWVSVGWGNVIRIVHKVPDKKSENGLRYVETLYAHLNAILVLPGDLVKRGEWIGTIGNANAVYYAHLHFEIRNDIFLMNGGGYGKRAGFLRPRMFIRSQRPRP